ncbi:MAG: RluA family pseudouridine synthase [bacterium]|nr:RluA family pseudouridine synthase [bacterium]
MKVNNSPKIICEKNDFLVIEKPAGFIVNRAETTKGAITIQDWVEKKFKVQSFPQSGIPPKAVTKFKDDDDFDSFHGRAGIVHRLDKDTSGLLLIAKTPEAFVELQRQFKERIVKKRYLSLVHGKLTPLDGTVEAPLARNPYNRKRFGVFLGGKQAKTSWKIINYYLLGKEIFTFLELSPETGRTHQIRIHLKYLGHPIVGDSFYAGEKTAREDLLFCPRLFLHASYLGFMEPQENRWVEFESGLSPDLAIVLKKLQICSS